MRINISNERINETTMDEMVPIKEELSRIFRMATPRASVSISLMAYSDLGSELLVNYGENDELTSGDIEDFDIAAVEFTSIHAKVNLRNDLSKISLKYFTFPGFESCKYLKDSLTARKASGETLTMGSVPLGAYSSSIQTYHGFLRIQLIENGIWKAIREANLTKRPYILRLYFALALHIAGTKCVISHTWRQYLIRHKGILMLHIPQIIDCCRIQ